MPQPLSLTSYNRLLLFVAGLGGLLYGVDVGIIASALPYLEATSKLTSEQLSFIVAAVLLGSVFSTLVAGLLADWLGRRTLMTISGVLFVASIPMIALAHGYGALIGGRLLQGISGGLIGVVVPLYLAECLGAASRGKGTGIFQWLLTLGIAVAALIGLYFSHRVEQVAAMGDAARLLAFKDQAWRSIFWVSLPPGAIFVIGSFLVAESPRWLLRRGRAVAAQAALARSMGEAEASLEIVRWTEPSAKGAPAAQDRGSLLRRKYVVPFLIACLILACNQATGVNSIIGYCTTILLQAGLSDYGAHTGYVLLTIVNFVVTMAGVALVDRKGRKFLLSLGTAGIVVSLVGAGLVFRQSESRRTDIRGAIQAQVTPAQTASIHAPAAPQQSLIVIYSCGGFRSASRALRSGDPAAIDLSREACLPGTKVAAFFSNPFASLDEARTAPLKIEHALLTPVPSESTGWLAAILIYLFMASFAIGPGVCVWLALSELMPTRIRSNGMSIALLINQAVSTVIAGIFLPTVGRFGYATMFFAFAGCAVVYFLTATFILPETKGKTLEEIEGMFEQ